MPTLAELAGIGSPPELDGSSLVPILDAPQTRGREFVLSQFSRPFKRTNPEVMGYSIRTDTDRYTRWIDWQTREVIAEELYDYKTSEIVANQTGALIENANLVEVPAYATKRRGLSTLLDATLGQQSKSQ